MSSLCVSRIYLSYLLYSDFMCGILSCVVVFFFFKQKTAYEMRISDWSSDVCSSDLHRAGRPAVAEAVAQVVQPDDVDLPCGYCALSGQDFPKPGDRKSVV